MKKLGVFLLCLALTAILLTGCGDTPLTSSAPAEEETAAVITTATESKAESVTTATTSTTADTTGRTSAKTGQGTTTTAATTKGTARTTATTKKASTTTAATTTRQTTTSTTTTKATTTTTVSYPATVNGKGYAIGDMLTYTVMVKTAQPYGTVKIGVRYLQKGLTVPNGLAIQQTQAVMNNIGIGRVGTMPEDTVGNNGFAMTVNKGYVIDTTQPDYAGLLWHYETTDYDYDNRVAKNIDCSAGVALFSIRLKITKPGEYILDCMEYATSPRTDLSVWGVLNG